MSRAIYNDDGSIKGMVDNDGIIYDAQGNKIGANPSLVISPGRAQRITENLARKDNFLIVIDMGYSDAKNYWLEFPESIEARELMAYACECIQNYTAYAFKGTHFSKNEVFFAAKTALDLWEGLSKAFPENVNYSENFLNAKIRYNKLTDQEKMLADQLLSKASAPQKKNGCYVATAVYGSYDCPQVWVLRRYRDHKLSTNPFGRAFIIFYYATAPTAIKLFGKAKWFNRFLKERLDRFVEKLKMCGFSDEVYKDKRSN